MDNKKSELTITVENYVQELLAGVTDSPLRERIEAALPELSIEELRAALSLYMMGMG